MLKFSPKRFLDKNIEKKPYKEGSKSTNRNVTKGIGKLVNLTVFFELCLGVCHIYVLPVRGYIIYFVKLYSLIIVTVCLYIILNDHANTHTAYVFFKYIMCLEYVLLVLLSTIGNTKATKNFVKAVNEFDANLKLTYSEYFFQVTKIDLLYVALILVYYMMDYCVLMYYDIKKWDLKSMVFYLAITVHDCEEIFFSIVIKGVSDRLAVIKGHVNKLAKRHQVKTDIFHELNIEDSLAKKVDLDVKTLYRSYETLHRSAVDLNSFISFPMLVMFIGSGLLFLTILKNVIERLQENLVTPFALIHNAVLCTKYIILMVFPCYFSHSSSRHVQEIRARLQDVLITENLDHKQRSQLEAFIHLTTEMKFEYSVYGVIDLTMSLPLSYCSIGITYLILSMQVNKFQ